MFKLIEIEFFNHHFFKNLRVQFVNEGEESAEYYTTLIIGPNGTGKSKILQSVINILNSLSSLKDLPKKYSFEFEYILKFLNKGKEYSVDYTNYKLFINGNEASFGYQTLDLPSKVLVSAFSFNDKYPLRENRGKVVNENYHYLGLKSTNNNIFLANPTKNAIFNLYNAIIYKKDILPLKEAFVILDLNPVLTLIYSPGKHFKFLQNNEFWENKEFTHDTFKVLFRDFKDKKKFKKLSNVIRLGDDKIEKLLSDKSKLEFLVGYLHENIRFITDLTNKEISVKPILDFEETHSFDIFTNHVKAFQLLVDFEIISFKRIEIKKRNTNFSLDDASSGEYHIILSFLNILSYIEENSLVIIDEPEISLHPNWQMRYMNIFKKIFNHFPNTHFIIATHSHFLVSDLKINNSNILAINFNKEKAVDIMSIEKNTYGWSTEQILLNVFKVASTRNYFLTKTITDVLKELGTENPDFNLVKLNLEEVIFLDTSDFNDHDPMKDIFRELTALYNEL